MAKLAAFFEAFLGIILTLSLLTFGWAYIDGMHTLDATPVSQITGQDTAVSESLLNAPVEPVETPQSNVPVIVVDDEAPEPESMTFVSSYTPPERRRSNRKSRKTSGVDQALADNGEARVIVSFSEPSEMGSVVDALEAMGAETHSEWSDGIAVTASADAINSLEGNGAIDLIEEDLPLQTMTYEGYDLINLEKVLTNDILTLDTVWPTLTTQNLVASGSHSLTGNGQTVALIDSGLTDSHAEFNGKVISQWDFCSNDYTCAGEDSEADDRWNHGTKMAGVIAAKGVNMDGMAPDADIVALKITNMTGGGWTSNLYNALDWVSKNASVYNITTIYIGLGVNLYDGSETICVGSSISTKIDELTNMNITVVAPAGHDGNTTAIAAPACVANTISVGGIADGGSNFADTWNFTAEGIQSNRRDGLLDILAPGSDGATMTTNRSNYIGGTGIGTSVSAAYVAGASMLLREYWDANGWDFREAGLVNGNIPNTIEYIFKQSGVQVEDYRNPGVSYPRLDMYAAINYEENVPVINLETINDSTEVEGTVTLEYNVTDQHDISSCSLYIDGALNQTNNSIIRDIAQSFSVDLGEAVYTWKVECVDDATVPNTGVSGTNTITVITIDSEVPQYSSLTASPNTYAPSQTYTLESTWTDNVAVDEVILEFDGVNYTDASKAGDVYSKTFTDLAAGNYNYVWYANDTSDNWNDTGVQVFTINKVSTTLSWNTTPAWSVLTGTETTVQCLADNPQISVSLYMDGSSVSNPDVQTLAVNTYDYVCNTTGNENYTADEISNTLTVTSKNPSIATLVFDKVSPQTYGTTIRATCTDTNPEADAKLYRDGVDVTATENGTDVTLAAGTYNYVCNVSETATYSFAEDTNSFTINKVSPNLVLNASPSWTEPEWTETTVSCSTNATGITVKLYFDGLEVSNPDVQTLNADTFDYVCNTTGNQNYSAESVSNTLNMTPVPDTTDPVVTLVNPTDTVTVISPSGNVSFQWNVTDNLDTLPYCKLWNDKSGTWAPDASDFFVANGTTTTYEDTGWTDGSYIWNVVCTDNEANSAFAAANWTFDVSVPDLTPPVISNVSEVAFNDSATITWNTDEGANNSQANYGITTALGTVIADLDQSLRTNHGIGLINLIPNTTYYYNVTSCDAVGNCATDGPYSFTTLPNAANQPPVISGIPDNETDEDTQPPLDWVDLWSYASDSDNATAELTFAVDSNSNPSLIDCFVNSDRYVRCSTPAANQSGFTDINVSVYDGEYYDYDVFRVTVNPVDDPAVWNALSNQAIDENSADGTVVYPNLGNQCSDIDSLVSIIPSASTHYILGFSGNDLIINSLEADWFGSETVDLGCNGVANSFTLTVNDVPVQQTCYTACTYGNCWTYCE